MKSESSMKRHIISLQEKVQRLKNENLELRRELGAIDGQSRRLREALRTVFNAYEETCPASWPRIKRIAREALGE